MSNENYIDKNDKQLDTFDSTSELNDNLAPRIVSNSSDIFEKKIISIKNKLNLSPEEEGAFLKAYSLLRINNHLPVEVYGFLLEILTYLYQNKNSK